MRQSEAERSSGEAGPRSHRADTADHVAEVARDAAGIGAAMSFVRSQREAGKENPRETTSDRTDSHWTIRCSDVGEEEVEVDERRHHRLIEHLRLQLRGGNALAAVTL